MADSIDGNTVVSNSVAIAPDLTPLAITRQPTDVTVAAGETATVSVAATGDGLTYQWYYASKTASTFSKASITTATYSVEMTTARAGRRLYCVITDTAGNTVTSDTVTLNMASSGPQITKQPTDVTVAAGENATVSVTATGDGLKYQWYYANKGSSTFSKASITTATYTVAMNSTRAGRRVYCVVTDAAGNTVTSDTVTLSMKAELKITKQPVGVVAPDGATVTITVAAEGTGLKYQWYNGKEGTSFSKSSVTTATYTVAMNSTRDGRLVYCVITDAAGNKVTSNTVMMKMGKPLKITKQPENVIVAENATAKVSVAAEGVDLTYQWYNGTEGSDTFTKSSLTSATYSIKMTAARHGRLVYCVITDAVGNTVTTDTVKLSMDMPLEIVDQPLSASAPAGELAEVTVNAVGNDLTYTWYYADKGSSTFRTSSTTTPTYSVSMGNSRDGRRLYCVITDAKGETVQTDTVIIVITEEVPSGLQYTVGEKYVTITGYIGTATTLHIPRMIEGKLVTTIGANAFHQNSTITHIELPNYITLIGKNAFSYSSLSSMDSYD